MPLVVFVGYPSSGKTTWATKLVEQLQQKIAQLQPNEPGANLKVLLHNDESLGISHDMYQESVTEKAARAAQISAVKRDISRNNIVILDSLSYIKGFRYQLFLEAKAVSTPHCVIQIMTPSEQCFAWNSKRESNDQWPENLLRELIMRYEEPDGQSRWDSPLIPVGYDDTELPFDAIWEAIALKKGAKSNASTGLKPAAEINFLQELETLTTQVVNEIVQYQNLNSIGGQVRVKNTNNDVCLVELPSTTVSIAQLQRFRRAYVALNKMRTVNRERIIPLFVEYLNRSFDTN